ARADARLAGITARTRVPVVARRAVGPHGAGACTRGRVADARLVALSTGAADDRVASGADAGLARVGLRARIAIVARGSVGLRRTGADARGGIADARIVTLIRGSADDRGPARAGARLARIDLSARVPVVAGGAITLRRAGARARSRVADACLMAL